MKSGDENGMAFSRAGNADDGWTPGRFALILALFLCASYPDVIFAKNSFFFRDFGFFGYPLAFYHKQSFWRGEIPLWNPLSSCGLPFLAQWNTLVFYPGSLLYLLFPISWSLNFFCLGHLFFAGLSMYFLASRWTENRLAASVAGLAYVFNGLALGCLMWPNNVAALAWMPLVVLCAEQAWLRGGRSLVAAALVGAVQMLSGAPEIILFTWLIVAALFAIHFFQGVLPRGKLIWQAGALVALVAGLAAVQLLPFLELLKYSDRGENFGNGNWAMPGTGWGNLFVPLFRDMLSMEGVYFQEDQFWTSSYYLGIGVLALAVYAVLKIRHWRVWLLSGVALFSLVVALGNSGFLYPALHKIFPLIGFMRFPIKIIVLCAFAVPLLAAFAVRRLRSSDEDPRPTKPLIFIGMIFLIIIAGLLWFSYLYPAQKENWPTTAVSGISRAVFLGALIGLFAAPKKFQMAFPKLIGPLILAVIAFDGITHAPRQNPTIPRGALEPGLKSFEAMNPLPRHGESRAMITPEVDKQLRFSKTADPLANYLVQRAGLFSNCNLLEGIPKVNGFYSLYPDRVYTLWYHLYIHSPHELSGLYDFLGISQMTVPNGKIFDWEARPSYQPLVTIGQKPVFAEGSDMLSALLSTNFNPSATVYLDKETRSEITATCQPDAKILKREISAHRIAVEADTPGPAMLVVAQNHYPAWKAYVDGLPTPIRYANHAFQAIEIPAGRHRIVFAYEDSAFKLGAIISIATLSLCVFLFFKLRKGTRIDSPEQDKVGD